LIFEDEFTIEEQVRSGDIAALDTLIQSNLRYITRLASLYAYICKFEDSDEADELIGVANLATRENREAIAGARHPGRYLRAIVRREMQHYCLYRRNGIKITERPEYRAQAPKQISLKAPIGNSEDLVYEDLISDMRSIEDELVEAEKQKRARRSGYLRCPQPDPVGHLAR